MSVENEKKTIAAYKAQNRIHGARSGNAQSMEATTDGRNDSDPVTIRYHQPNRQVTTHTSRRADGRLESRAEAELPAARSEQEQ